MGFGQETQFQNYHRVLNRAVWSGLGLGGRLLRVLVDTFVPAEAAIVLGADETLEGGGAARTSPSSGATRDAARSTARNKGQEHGVALAEPDAHVPLPWASRPLGAAVPDRVRTHPCRGRSAQAAARDERGLVAADAAAGGALAARTPLSVLVADGGVGVGGRRTLRSDAADARPTHVTRLRLDARLFDPPPPRRPGTRGRKRVVGARQMKASQRLGDAQTVWQTARLTWADGKLHAVEWASDTALWYVNCKPVLPSAGCWCAALNSSRACSLHRPQRPP